MDKTTLKTSLAHLPLNKQEELKDIREIILNYVPQTEMIILFGSYARGDWVEDVYQENGTTYEYNSDFDILVVTNKKIEDIHRCWRKVRSKIDSKPLLTKTTIINHAIHFLNERIKHSYYFFVDIAKEGVMLYDSGRHELAVPEVIGPKKRLQKAEQYLHYWMNEADEFMVDFRNAFERGSYKKAAFYLHQAAENYYAVFSLVLTDYKPKTHDLEDLRSRAIKINEAQREVFPSRTEEEQYRFDLLKRAYIEARYNENYHITEAELTYLAERVLFLKELITQLSTEEIRKIELLKEPK